MIENRAFFTACNDRSGRAVVKQGLAARAAFTRYCYRGRATSVQRNIHATRVRGQMKSWNKVRREPGELSCALVYSTTDTGENCFRPLRSRPTIARGCILGASRQFIAGLCNILRDNVSSGQRSGKILLDKRRRQGRFLFRKYVFSHADSRSPLKSQSSAPHKLIGARKL